MGAFSIGGSNNNASGSSVVVGTGNTITLYNTADQTTNYERVKGSWSSNIFTLYTEQGGSGTLRDLRVGNSANNYINISATAPGANGACVTAVCAGTSRVALGVTATSYGAIWVNASGGSSTAYRWASNDTDIINNAAAGGTHNFSFAASATALAINLTTTTSTHTRSESSGTANIFNINPTISQTSTAGYSALRINVTESTTGSGTKRAIEMSVGGTVKAGFLNTGVLEYIAANTAATVGAAGGASALPATPTGYAFINIAGTQKKIPYYEN